MKLQTKFLSILIPLILAPLLIVSITAHWVLQSSLKDSTHTQTQILTDQVIWAVNQSKQLARQYIAELRNNYVLSPELIAEELNTFHQLRPDILNIMVKQQDKILGTSGQFDHSQVVKNTPLSGAQLQLTKQQGFQLNVQQTAHILGRSEPLVINLTLPLVNLNKLVESSRRKSHVIVLLSNSEGELLTQEKSLKKLLPKSLIDTPAFPITWNNKNFMVTNAKVDDGLYMSTLTPTMNVTSATDKLNALLSYIAIVAGLISVVVLHKSISSLVTSPLARFQRHTQNIIRGSSSHINSLKRTDEIGEFARSFNDMRKHLLSTTEQIEELAYYDTLTGLPNKVTFIDTIQNLIEKSTLTGHQLAIVFFDLDNFKHINDALGHETGDTLLMEVSTRLKECIRSHDVLAHESHKSGKNNNSMIARLGGDEFTLVLSKINSPEEAAKVASRILQKLAVPFNIGDNELFISASMGISMYPKDGKTPEALLKNADTAMYAAKASGKNHSRFYDSKMNKPVLERIELEASMRSALANNEFILYYQPKVPIFGETHFEFETLMRWNHAEKGMISPGLFIPLAEDTGYIQTLGDWAIEQTCRQIELWNRKGYKNVSVSTNLSPVQLNYGNPLQTIKQALSNFDIKPEQLEIEITESGLMQNEQHAVELLNQIKSLGVRIALDDFGTGYSSLAYLLKFPIDTLKIDRTFIRDIDSHPESLKVLESIIGLAKSLNLHVVAEGVETKEQLDLLLQRKCNYIQGFYFARPTEPQQAMAFFEEHFASDPQLSDVPPLKKVVS